MRLKILIGVPLAALLCATTYTAATSRFRSARTSALATLAAQLPEVQAIQLSSVGGIIPVEILEHKVIPSQDTSFGALQFIIKNNTNKSIDAIVVSISSTATLEGGREETATIYKTRNRLIHPDIREIHGQKPIEPGIQVIFDPEPLMPMGHVTAIKKIVLSLDYVDFEDRTSLGAGKQAPSSIFKVREGASKYKEWLVQQFVKSDKSRDKLFTLLKATEFPEELSLAKGHEIIGARLYRKHLLQAYEEHGFGVLEKYLK